MKNMLITEIRLENTGRLVIKPETGAFPYIYRAGLSVYWDNDGRYFYNDLLQGQSLPESFKNLLKAVREEYGINLQITDLTVWCDIPGERIITEE